MSDNVGARLQAIEKDAEVAQGAGEMGYAQVKALCEITRQLSRIADAYESVHAMGKHYHVAKYVDGRLTDECSHCGRDLRDEIHKREELRLAQLEKGTQS